QQAVPLVKPPTAAIPPAAGQAAQVPPAVVQAGAAQPRRGQLPPGPRQTLRSVVSAETAKNLNFGISPDGAPIGPDDFASEGSVSFEVPMPEGAFTLDLQVDAVLGLDRDQV